MNKAIHVASRLAKKAVGFIFKILHLITRITLWSFWVSQVILFVLVFCITILFPLYYSYFPYQCTITSEPVVILQAEYNPVNNMQTNTSVWMGTYNGQLYFYPKQYANFRKTTRFKKSISVFRNGGADVLLKLDLGQYIVGMNEGYIYYLENSNLYCYDVLKNETTLVSTYCSPHLFTPTGSWLIRKDETDSKFYAVHGDTVESTPIEIEPYTLNGKLYVRPDRYYHDFFTVEKQGEQEIVQDVPIQNESNCILYSEEGLLVLQKYDRNILRWICANSGEIVELFSIPDGHPDSAVNIHGNDVYLSFNRDFLNKETGNYYYMEEDPLVGTYRISLDDFSTEKISDSIYSGLYIFDDSGIFACDENCHIYKLDFDGNLISTILE